MDAPSAEYRSHGGAHARRANILPRPPLELFLGPSGADGLEEELGKAAALLDMDLVLLGHVNDATYTTVAFYCRHPSPSLRRGDTIPIGETYCREEISSNEPFLLADATVGPYADHAGWTRHGLRAYAGAAIVLPDGRLFGTLCGVDTRPRPLGPDMPRGLASIAARVANEIGRRIDEALLDRAPPRLPAAGIAAE